MIIYFSTFDEDIMDRYESVYTYVNFQFDDENSKHDRLIQKCLPLETNHTIVSFK